MPKIILKSICGLIPPYFTEEAWNYLIERGWTNEKYEKQYIDEINSREDIIIIDMIEKFKHNCTIPENGLYITEIPLEKKYYEIEAPYGSFEIITLKREKILIDKILNTELTKENAYNEFLSLKNICNTFNDD